MDAKEKEEVIRKKYQRLHRAMDERARRLWAAAEAESLGYGGVSIVSRATGLTRNTITSGIDELASLDDPAHPDPRRIRCPGADRLLITADGGGCDSSRSRPWLVSLQGLADATGMRVSVCHFPPGTSKWNKIEHRMFCHITGNWRGQPPLTSREVVLNLIRGVRTATGLTIQAEMDEMPYPAGIKVSDDLLATVRIERDAFHPGWNYSISPNQWFVRLAS